ncbi:hypothetical protein IFM12276_61130 [Nocardia sputorum]|uniref:Uncharacterized protein n=1 Tax=Nocardia sputorum TaxID=2984338 RepID=A0ABN6UD04_9NOCA|nr:hypothetical protein IFM12276_61130 [Nocardia sputorum]
MQSGGAALVAGITAVVASRVVVLDDADSVEPPFEQAVATAARTARTSRGVFRIEVNRTRRDVRDRTRYVTTEQVTHAPISNRCPARAVPGPGSNDQKSGADDL